MDKNTKSEVIFEEKRKEEKDISKTTREVEETQRSRARGRKEGGGDGSAGKPRGVRGPSYRRSAQRHAAPSSA